jgi:hypothetical protein
MLIHDMEDFCSVVVFHVQCCKMAIFTFVYDLLFTQ